jgi:hypothetical protein
MSNMNNHRDFAVVVGIDKYEDQVLGNLKGAKNDATAFVAWLKDQNSDGDFSDDQIITRMPQATFSDLNRALHELLESVGSGGRRLYIFVAGHGGRGLNETFVYASEHSRHVDACWDIIKAAEGLRSLFREIVMFMDCCRAGAPDTHSSEIRMRIKANQAPGSHFYCFACPIGGSTTEGFFDGRIRGVFSETLLRALRGDVESAVDHRGQVTAHSLKRYLTSQSIEPKPDFDPRDDQYLRGVVLAKGFPPHDRTFEIKLSKPWDGFGLFSGADLSPLSWKRTPKGSDTVIVEREDECVVVVTVPDVSDIKDARTRGFVLPTQSLISI